MMQLGNICRCLWHFLSNSRSCCELWARTYAKKGFDQMCLQFGYILVIFSLVFISYKPALGTVHNRADTQMSAVLSCHSIREGRHPRAPSPLMSLNTWRPLFTFPLRLPHRFVTLPKGTPLAWPCTEPPNSHLYLTHTHNQAHTHSGGGWYA